MVRLTESRSAAQGNDRKACSWQYRHQSPSEPKTLESCVGLQRRVLPRRPAGARPPSPSFSTPPRPERRARTRARRARAGGAGGHRGGGPSRWRYDSARPADGRRRAERPRRRWSGHEGRRGSGAARERPERCKRNEGRVTACGAGGSGRAVERGAGPELRPSTDGSSGHGRRQAARGARQPGTCAAEHWAAQPHGANGKMCGRSYRSASVRTSRKR